MSVRKLKKRLEEWEYDSHSPIPWIRRKAARMMKRVTKRIKGKLAICVLFMGMFTGCATSTPETPDSELKVIEFNGGTFSERSWNEPNLTPKP